MIKHIGMVTAFIGAVVLSGASVAQADVPGLGQPVGAALPRLSAADPVPWYDCSGKEDGNYPHPSDNTKFMSCVAQHYAYEQNCPSGQHFDPQARECD